jgi:hypothetical protein
MAMEVLRNGIKDSTRVFFFLDLEIKEKVDGRVPTAK